VKSVGILYHMARADILERVRRYSFLIMLGLVLWLGYLSASGLFRLSVPPDYTGVINSAWVGATMTITVSFFLTLFGFYLIKGSVSRDYETGVGQILATTPLSRPLYTLGKWISNFCVLSIMILLMLIVGILMNLLVGTSDIELGALSAPLLFVALPCMALVAAAAVLFESIRWLRGGFGNIVYFFLFITVSIFSVEGAGPDNYNPWIDFAGWQLIGNSITRAAQVVYPESLGGFVFSITDMSSARMFVWNGIDWTGEIILSRLYFMAMSIGIGLLAAVFFDRFNPTRLLGTRHRKTGTDQTGLEHSQTVNDSDSDQVAVAKTSTTVLTPLKNVRTRFRFDALFATELKLFIKGQHWWWYMIGLSLIIAQYFNSAEVNRNLLVIAWLWPILILSRLGCREAQYNTQQIVFSAPRPISNQLPAQWLSAALVLMVMGSGTLVQLLAAGETFSVLGWITGILFIPSLALASGVLTGSSKTFEVLYVVWMYMLTQEMPLFDFAGMTPQAPLVLYAVAALVLLAGAVFARRGQLKNR
jgi:ABC-type transport system involved in multi-copper enzyme maturation permease subunit